MRRRFTIKFIAATILVAIMTISTPYVAIKVDATSYITNASNVKGSNYTSSPTLAAVYDKIFSGDIDIIQNSTGKEVNMPLGYRMLDYNDANSKYKIVSKTTGNSYYAWECQAYANAVYNKLFNEWVGNGGTYAHSKNVINGGINSVSYSLFKTAGVKSGAYIRTTDKSSGAYNGDAGHAMILLSYDSTHINYIEGNADANGLIRITKRTWTEFNNAQLKGRGRYICHIVQPKESYYNSLYGDTIEDAITNIAKNQSGSYGSDINKFTSWFYGKENSAAWCAVFISWCADQAGVLNSAIPKEDNCNNMMSWFKNRNAFYAVDSGYIPQKGDIVFYNTNGTGVNHVEFISASGYITENEQNKIKVIGGNTSDSSFNGSDYVAEKIRNIDASEAKVVGYANPSYNGTYPKSTHPDDYTFPTKDLYYTSPIMTGNDVGWIQAFLYQMGYDIDVDCKFGPATETCVKTFQEDYGLTVNGRVNLETREKMQELWEGKNHSECIWEPEAIIQAPTHMVPGIIRYICTICGSTKTGPIYADHNFGDWAYYDESRHIKECECGDSIISEHTWDQVTITETATCKTDGIRTYTCTGCYTTKNETIPATGHNYSDWEWNTETSHISSCVCGNYIVKPHTWNEGEIAYDPTDTMDGLIIYTCTGCHSQKTETIPKINEEDHLAGDINGDGVLNGEDVNRLMQYLAGWNVDVNELALDVNGDGRSNNKDVSRLIQHLAGWNVDIY